MNDAFGDESDDIAGETETVGRQRRQRAIAGFDQLYGPHLAMARYRALHPEVDEVDNVDDLAPEAKAVFRDLLAARVKLEELPRDELLYLAQYALEYAADHEAT